MLRTRLPFFPLFLDGEGDPSGPGTATVVPAPPPSERRNDSQPGLRGDADSGAVNVGIRELREAYARGEIALETQTTPAPVQTPAAPIQEPAAGETPTPEAAAEAQRTAAAAAEAAAAAAGGEGDDGPLAEDDPLLTIELVPRRGQDPITIRVEDRETAEALRATRNLASRTEAAEARVADVRHQQAQLEAFEEMLELDPVGVVIEKMTPAEHLTMVRHLLAQPNVLEQVVEDLARWQENPDAREAAALRLQNERLTTRAAVQTQAAQRAADRAIVENITSHVERLAELVDPGLAGQFRYDALGDMANIDRNPRTRFTGPVAPDQVPAMLAARLRLYGITPEQAVAALRTDAQSTPHPSTQPRPKGPAAVALAASPAAQGAKANGQQFVKASRVRQAAAAAAPAPGAAITLPDGTQPPKGAGVKGRIAWLRSRLPGARS